MQEIKPLLAAIFYKKSKILIVYRSKNTTENVACFSKEMAISIIDKSGVSQSIIHINK